MSENAKHIQGINSFVHILYSIYTYIIFIYSFSDSDDDFVASSKQTSKVILVSSDEEDKCLTNSKV